MDQDAAMVLRGGRDCCETKVMSQAYRITIGTIVLAPIVAAFLLTGFPAHAAMAASSAPLSDPRVGTNIEKAVKDCCRAERTGSVEHSICVAEARKNAYRAAAANRGELIDTSYSVR